MVSTESEPTEAIEKVWPMFAVLPTHLREPLLRSGWKLPLVWRTAWKTFWITSLITI